MLLQREIQQMAEAEGMLPDTIDKDWVLGHFLAELYRCKWAQENLVFKGGTCLKKCYFADYRFSEDLDFTLSDPSFQVTDKMLQAVCDQITTKIGILFSTVRIEPITWKDNRVGYKTHIRFWGANHKKAQQPSPPDRWQTEIKVEIISYEQVVQQPIKRSLYANYSDRNLFDTVRIPCYSLTEIVAEKFRALLQRSYPAPRDYYDLWHLLKPSNQINAMEVVALFKHKAAFKGIPFTEYADFFDSNQLDKAKKAWLTSLQHHLKANQLPDFDVVISDLQAHCMRFDW